MTLYINCSNGDIVSQQTETATAREKECTHVYERREMGLADPVGWAKCIKCDNVIVWDGLTKQWN